MAALSDHDRLVVARRLAEQVGRREVPDPALLTEDARFDGSIFGTEVGVIPVLLRDRLVQLAAADPAYHLGFRECFAAPRERVVVIGVAKRRSTAELVGAVYGFRDARVSNVEAFHSVAAAFERVGLTYPPHADVERLAATTP